MLPPSMYQLGMAIKDHRDKKKEGYQCKDENGKETINNMSPGTAYLVLFIIFFIWIYAILILASNFDKIPAWAQIIGILGVIPTIPVGPIITIFAVILGKAMNEKK